MAEGDTPKIPDRRPSTEGYWLTPGKTPHANALLRGPTPDVGDLDVELCISGDGTLCSESAWDLDDHQRELVAAGAHIRLAVWQHPIPPLSVELEAPFCKSCGAPLVYVKSERQFFCAGACPERDPRFGPAPVQPIDTGATNGSQPEDDRDTSRRALDQAHSDFEPAKSEPDDEEDQPPA